MNDTIQYLILKNWSLIIITGPDSSNYLQGQLSCNLLNVTTDQPQLGLYLNPKGRIIANLIVFKVDDGFALIMPHDVITAVDMQLKKYGLFSKITITPQAAGYVIFAGTGNNIHELKSHGCYLLQQQNLGLGIIKKQEQSLLDEITSNNNFDDNDFIKKLILARWPLITAATSGEFLPHYIGLVDLDAVDFDKGCYLGQEIVARMHYRAQIKKHLQIFKINQNTPLKPGENFNIILDNKKISIQTIQSASFNDDEQLLLASVSDDIPKSGNNLSTNQKDNINYQIISN